MLARAKATGAFTASKDDAATEPKAWERPAPAAGAASAISEGPLLRCPAGLRSACLGSRGRRSSASDCHDRQ